MTPVLNFTADGSPADMEMYLHLYESVSEKDEPGPSDKMEIEYRIAKMIADKAARGHIPLEYDKAELRHSHAVNRCLGNGSRHRSNMIGRNY